MPSEHFPDKHYEFDSHFSPGSVKLATELFLLF